MPDPVAVDSDATQSAADYNREADTRRSDGPEDSADRRYVLAFPDTLPVRLGG